MRPAALTIEFVFKKLHAIAMEKGSGAAGRRQRVVVGLINRCRCARRVPQLMWIQHRRVQVDHTRQLTLARLTCWLCLCQK